MTDYQEIYVDEGTGEVLERPMPEAIHGAPMIPPGDMLVVPIGGMTFYAPDWPSLGSLHGKVNKALSELDRLEKRGVNEDQGWAYLTASDVADAARKAIALSGLAHYVGITDKAQAIVSRGKYGNWYSEVEIAMTLADPDTGAMAVIRWFGEAADYGTCDKGLNKAGTGATKYALIKGLILSSKEENADDPDRHEKGDQEGAGSGGSGQRGRSQTRRTNSTKPQQQPAQQGQQQGQRPAQQAQKPDTQQASAPEAGGHWWQDAKERNAFTEAIHAAGIDMATALIYIGAADDATTPEGVAQTRSWCESRVKLLKAMDTYAAEEAEQLAVSYNPTKLRAWVMGKMKEHNLRKLDDARALISQWFNEQVGK